MDLLWNQRRKATKLETASVFGVDSIASNFYGAMVERPFGKCPGHYWDANVWIAAPQELILDSNLDLLD